MDIDRIWEEIERWLATSAPNVGEQLRGPASSLDIAWFSRRTRLELPDDFRRSVLRHDGTSPSSGLLGGRELLSIRQGGMLWQEECRRATLPNVRRWIPVAVDPVGPSSHFLCLGDTGLLIASWRLDLEPLVVESSFTEWLGAIRDDMLAGRVSVEGEHLVYAETSRFHWPPTTHRPTGG